MRRLDLRDELRRIASRTLVCVGDRDPLMFDAADEILAGLGPGVGKLEVIQGAGHFPWLDAPDVLFRVIVHFVSE